MTDDVGNPCPPSHWVSDEDCFPSVTMCAQCADARASELRAVVEQQAARIAELESDAADVHPTSLRAQWQRIKAVDAENARLKARITELERLLALADEAAECQNRRVAALERRAHCTCAVDAAANNPRCPIHGTP